MPEEERYAVLSVLGQGAMGRVLRVWDERLPREVARKEPVGPDFTAAAARLRREIEALSTLRHPGIPPVLDAGGGEHPWFTLPVYEGESLAQALLSPAEARSRLLESLARVAEALGAAHAAGWVHRDVKPENIVLDPDGPHLLDWGLARRAGDAAGPSGTRPGGIVGTPAYMSPEQVAGGAVGPPSDVWSLGVVLCEILGGRGVHPGATEAEILRRLLLGEATPPPVPAPYAPLVRACLSRDPAARPSEGSAFAARLRALLSAPGSAPARPPRGRRRG